MSESHKGLVLYSAQSDKEFGHNLYRLESGEIVKGTCWDTVARDGSSYRWSDKISLGIGTFYRRGTREDFQRFAKSFDYWIRDF